MERLQNDETVAMLDYSSIQAKRTDRGEGGYPVIKRIADVLLSSAALILLSPFLIIVMAAIRLDSRGNAIYVQERIGRNGKRFRMYKFRSMCRDAEQKLQELQSLNEADGPAFKMQKDPRVTRVGRFIRRYSIDELPQLVNIIKGDMSIVGPRPPLPNEVEQYNSHHRRRLEVAPGLTCYWQISGRSDLSFEDWVGLDIKYIEERGLWTDAKIILKTFKAVLSGKGAY